MKKIFSLLLVVLVIVLSSLYYFMKEEKFVDARFNALLISYDMRFLNEKLYPNRIYAIYPNEFQHSVRDCKLVENEIGHVKFFCGKEYITDFKNVQIEHKYGPEYIEYTINGKCNCNCDKVFVRDYSQEDNWWEQCICNEKLKECNVSNP